VGEFGADEVLCSCVDGLQEGLISDEGAADPAQDVGVDPEFYATRPKGIDEVLPWDHLDAGVEKRFLLREWEKAQRAETTHDCRKGCTGCGLKRYEGACCK